MSTTSSLPQVKAQLVSLLSTALDPVPCFFGWNPDVTDECVFLGRALLDPTDRDEVTVEYEYPTAETNRPVNESYSLPLSVWSFRGDLTPDEADEAEVRIGELIDSILGVLADVDLGIAQVNSRPDRIVWRRVPFEAGWACFAVTDLAVTATLT